MRTARGDTKASYKKVLRRIAVGLGFLVVLSGLLLLYAAVVPVPRYAGAADGGAGASAVRPSSDRIERGRRIASMRCFDCHVDPRTRRASGRRLTSIPSIMGTSFSGNLTHDRETGIGAYSDAELVHLLRTGVARDGRLMPPWMAPLRRMADEDVESLVAFLRSDDPSLAPTPSTSKGSASVVQKLLFHFVWRPAAVPENRIDGPAREDRVASGKYVVQTLASCWTCHSGSLPKLDHDHPERTAGYLAGGTSMRDASGAEVVSANLTPDDESGIGRWSEVDFAKALRQGLRPDGVVLRYPMPRYQELTDEEVSAAYAYLRSVPPIRSARRSESPTAGTSRHEDVYRKYGCNTCHGLDGVGVADLRRATDHYPTDAELEAWIRHPSRLKPGTRMPDYDGVIAAEDFPLLLQHVRALSLKRP